MRKIIFMVICLFILVGSNQAQYYIYSDPEAAYQAALEAIEEARVSGKTELVLERFGLEELPPEIGNVNTLETLYLGGNQLDVLPPEIGKLNMLQNLFLSNNQLNYLPPEIGRLTDLQFLVLSDNQLLTIPPEIGNLAALSRLYLNNNQLNTLPSEIGKLTTLSDLLLMDNPLQSPPPEVISQGIPAIQDYLRDQAASHLRKMIAGAAGGVGMLAVVGLAIRWRLRSRRKDKKKRA